MPISRAPESRTGNNCRQLADLRESGAIEQDADVGASFSAKKFTSLTIPILKARRN
jgi:hypothetical protein